MIVWTVKVQVIILHVHQRDFRLPITYFLSFIKTVYPTQTSTLVDFGFINCSNEQEKSYLFGIYIGLIKYYECPRKELEEHRKRDKNAELIDKYYLQDFSKFILNDYYK
jgi:hypothetical protein